MEDHAGTNGLSALVQWSSWSDTNLQVDSHLLSTSVQSLQSPASACSMHPPVDHVYSGVELFRPSDLPWYCEGMSPIHCHPRRQGGKYMHQIRSFNAFCGMLSFTGPTASKYSVVEYIEAMDVATEHVCHFNTI